MRIAYNNYADDHTILSSSPAIVNYPVSNVQDNRLSQTYRTTTLSNATIIFNLGEYAGPLVTIALINHNLSSSATVIVEFENSYVFPGASTLTVTVAFNTNMILNFSNIGTYAYAHILAETGDTLTTESGDQFILENILQAKLTITDINNANGYIELGRVWIGDYMTIDPSSLLDFKIIKKRSDVVMYNRNRQKWAYPGVGWRRFELSFPPSEETMVSQINTLYDTVGNHSSFIFCNFDTIRNYVLVEPCYVSIDGNITFSHTERMKMNYSLNLEEDL